MRIIFFLLGLMTWAGCSGGSDRREGALGDSCYPNDTCNQGLLCSDGICEEAEGQVGGPCYPNQTCNADLECVDSVCVDQSIGTDGGLPDASGSDAASQDASVGPVWIQTTTSISGLKQEMHFVSPTEIYAVVNNKISLWNGSAWVDHTLDAIGIASAIHFVSPTEIYAVVGNRVDMWTGTLGIDGLWTSNMTGDIAGINKAGSAEIHVIAADDIYAVIDNGVAIPYIAHWNGTAWAEHTLPVESLHMAITFISPTEIYAVIDLKISKWTGLAWTDLSSATQNLRPALQAVSDSEIYGIIDTEVSLWNGTSWTPVAAPLPGIVPKLARAETDYYAIVGTSIRGWVSE